MSLKKKYYYKKELYRQIDRNDKVRYVKEENNQMQRDLNKREREREIKSSCLI